MNLVGLTGWFIGINIIQMGKILFGIVSIVLLVSLFLNFSLWKDNRQLDSQVQSNKEFQKSLEKYPYLSPRILNIAHSDFLLNFLDLRNNLHQKIDPLNDKFAMYFEYLPTGTSIGINSGNEFYSASLFKLPVVMAYFRHKENTNSTTDVKIRLTKDMIDDRFGDLWQKGEGYEIGLDEAAQIALTKSDNTAAKALGVGITQNDFDDVYKGIDINLQITDKGTVMTTKNYSSILKSLYFSAVLSRDDSEKILAFLTESEFNDKLIAGIPSGVVVAHKIGVIDNESYMDCGIVYVPKRPYILCMVSKGTEDEARQRMSGISKMIYDYVSNTRSLDVDN